MFNTPVLGTVVFCVLLAIGGGAKAAMSPLGDEELAAQTGEGIGIIFTDINFTMSPTTYSELSGTEPATADYDRGDLRWYGMSTTGSTGAGAWAGLCGPGIMDLGCPIGGFVTYLAPHDNPFIFRAFSIKGIDFSGASNVSKNVAELLWPSRHEPYRFAWWGELEVDRSNAHSNRSRFQMQNIYNNIQQGGTKVRWYQHADPADPTFAMMYHNYFAADIRMSVKQTPMSPDALAEVPEFEENEGLYIEDYRIYFPIGQPHYMALTINNVSSSPRNFFFRLTPVPNVEGAYNNFYGRTSTQDPTLGYDRSKWQSSYSTTHGFVRWGDWVPTGTAGGACMPDRPTCTGTTARANTYRVGTQGLANGYGNGQGEIGNKSTAGTAGMFFSAAAGGTFLVPNFPNAWGPMPDLPAWTESPSAGTNTNLGGFANGDNASFGQVPMGCSDGCTPRSSINLGDSRIDGMLLQTMYIKTLGI